MDCRVDSCDFTSILRQAWDDMARLVKLGRKVFLVSFSNGNIFAAEWILWNLDHVAGAPWGCQRYGRLSRSDVCA